MNFIKNILSSLIALIIFSFFLFILLFAVVSLVSQDEPVTIKDNSILHIQLNKPISEVEFKNPLADMDLFPTAPSTIGLVELKQAIAHARDDDKIKGIYLDAPYVKAGMAAIEDIREALIDFQSSGKFIIAFGEFYTEGSYYLASVADNVYLSPQGEVEFNGLSANLIFFKGLFEKLEIEPQVFRVGDFKSAVEPFIRKDMSEENRLQLTSLLNSLSKTFINNMSESRGMPQERLMEIAQNMLVRIPDDAVTYGLVDSLLYFDEVLELMKQRSEVGEGEELRLVSYSDYKKSYSTYKKSGNEIAVIVAAGEIVMGKGEMDNIGSDKFTKEIRKARENDDIKAIVLRINSPGGSFNASDALWREIHLAAQEKVVIASMSDMAASGGYYMAMACDTIIAQPTTITGSIGIFGIIFNFKGFLNNKLGITTDEVKTGEFSSLHNMSRPLTEAEGQIIQNYIDRGYETFVTKAAQGRGMSVDDLKKVASGRVWTGAQAQEIGLVDVLGDFNDAIDMAASSAGIADDYKVRYYPEQKDFLEQLLGGFEGDTKSKIIREELGETYQYLEGMERVKNMQGIQARIPVDVEIN